MHSDRSDLLQYRRNGVPYHHSVFSERSTLSPPFQHWQAQLREKEDERPVCLFGPEDQVLVG